jgi:hypothetical protein
MAGELERVKVGAWTTRVTLVVAVSLPEVPVMEMAVVDAGADALAVSVNTVDPEVGFVPQAAVTPLGSEELTARVMLPLNPSASVTAMAVVVVPP